MTVLPNNLTTPGPYLWCLTLPFSTFYYNMKKLLILAVGAATLSLGACNRGTCPAYSSAKATAAPVMASAATPAARQ